jgi:hypothetical protein
MAGESLNIVKGNAAGSSIALEAELVIGRSTPGLGSLGGDSEISRVHARIYHDPSGQLMVEDLGSTNGTFVNGARIGGVQPLRAGDQVRVGQTTMSVEGGAGQGATTVGQIVPPAAAAVPPAAAAVAATPPTQPFQPAQPPQGPPPPGQYGQQPGYAGGPIGGPPGRQTGSSKAPWIALAAVVVIALIVAGLAIGGVFSSDSKKSTAIAPVATTPAPAPAATTPAPPPAAAMPTPPPQPAPSSGGGYPPGIIPKLADRCAASGKLSRSRCLCTFQTLQGQLTFIQLIDALKKTNAGNPPPVIIAALRKCLNA